MITSYEFCKMCICSKYVGYGFWFCTKHKIECNKLWNKKFVCNEREEL